MSAYQEALRRYRRAASSRQAAQGDSAAREADAELDEATRVLRRFEIDPEYRGQQHRKAAA